MLLLLLKDYCRILIAHTLTCGSIFGHIHCRTDKIILFLLLNSLRYRHVLNSVATNGWLLWNQRLLYWYYCRWSILEWHLWIFIDSGFMFMTKYSRHALYFLLLFWYPCYCVTILVERWLIYHWSYSFL